MNNRKLMTKKTIKKGVEKHYVAIPKELTCQTKGRGKKLELNALHLKKTKINLENLLKDLTKERNKIERQFIARTDELEQEKTNSTRLLGL